MKFDFSDFDKIISEINASINTLSRELMQSRNELSALDTERREIQLELDDLDKIIASYSSVNSQTRDLFSPVSSDDDQRAEIEEKKSQREAVNLKLSSISEKCSAKELEVDTLTQTAETRAGLLAGVTGAVENLKAQAASAENAQFIKRLKDIVQKKRLISLDKNRYSPVVRKFDTEVYEPLQTDISQVKLSLDFISADPVRAKQELEKAYKLLNDTAANARKTMDHFIKAPEDKPLTDALNTYIGYITDVYPNIKFHMTVVNLESINHISLDLNRWLMKLISSLLNCFILRCSPLMIYLRFAYEEGNLNITGKVLGKYVNFYNEMKASPSSAAANLYEKVFLLDGTMDFKDNQDDSFNVRISLPVKNYF